MNKLRLSTKWWTLCLLALVSVISTASPYFMGVASAATANCPIVGFEPTCTPQTLPDGCTQANYTSQSGVQKSCPSTSPAVTGNPGSGAGNTIPAGCPGTNSTTRVSTPPTNCPSSTTGSTTPSTGDGTCEKDSGSLGWITCSIIQALSKGVDGIYDNLIKPFLKTDPISIAPNKLDGNGQNSNPQLAAWSSFRLIGDIILVIVLLIIVFGQSIGGGMLDAYSVKKILPRILVTAVLINLSYYIVALAVDVTNVIAVGIGTLIMQPFNVAGLTVGGGGTTFGLATFIGGAWAALVTTDIWFGMFMLNVLLPAILVMIGILAVLILRQGLIIFLIIISPVAFALYCLPNTEQYFKKWWDLFYKTLLMYPIISVLFALSKVFSAVIGTEQGAGGPVKGLISVLVLFVPLFLIPFAFKLAGGALATIHQAVSGAGKRAHEGIKGNVNDPDSLRNRTKRNAFAKAASRNLSGRGVMAAIDPRGGGIRRRREAMASIRNGYEGIYGKQGTSAKMFEEYKDDSNVTKDLALYKTGAASRNAIQDQVDLHTSSGGLEGFSKDSDEYNRRIFSSEAADKIGRTPFMRRQALMNPATIGYGLDGGEAGWTQATAVMRELAGGSASDPTNKGNAGTYASLMNQFQYVAKTAAGRGDLAAAVDGGEYSGDRAYSQTSLYENANAKGTAIKGHGAHFLKSFNTGGEAGKQKAAVFYKELQATIPNAKGGTRDAIQEQLEALNHEGMMDDYLDSTTNVVDPRTKNLVQTTQTVADPSLPSGRRQVTRNATKGETLSGVRTYERPDQNRT